MLLWPALPAPRVTYFVTLQRLLTIITLQQTMLLPANVLSPKLKLPNRASTFFDDAALWST